MREKPPTYLDILKEAWGVNKVRFCRGFRNGLTVFLFIPKILVDIGLLLHIYVYPDMVFSNEIIIEAINESTTSVPMIFADILYCLVILYILWAKPGMVFGESNP